MVFLSVDESSRLLPGIQVFFEFFCGSMLLSLAREDEVTHFTRKSQGESLISSFLLRKLVAWTLSRASSLSTYYCDESNLSPTPPPHIYTPQWAWKTSSASSPNPANHANRITAVAATAAEAETKIANADIITTTAHIDTETAHETTNDDTDTRDTATAMITTARGDTAKDSAANRPDATRSATKK